MAALRPDPGDPGKANGSRVGAHEIERAVRRGYLRAARAHCTGSRVVIRTRDLLEFLGIGEVG